jgi:hypothetical protein
VRGSRIWNEINAGRDYSTNPSDNKWTYLDGIKWYSSQVQIETDGHWRISISNRNSNGEDPAAVLICSFTPCTKEGSLGTDGSGNIYLSTPRDQGKAKLVKSSAEVHFHDLSSGCDPDTNHEDNKCDTPMKVTIELSDGSSPSYTCKRGGDDHATCSIGFGN